MSRHYQWPIAIIVLALAADLAVVADVHVAIRAVVVLSFLVVGPGLAFVRLIGFTSGYVEYTLAIALSLTLDTIVAETLIMARLWSVSTAMAILVFLTLVGVVLQIVSPVPLGQRTGEE
ncbi:MAG TPA: hypothetical protein VF960_12095 [Chloroflexota bacterium]